jgi:prephenate dehydratase
VSASAGQSRIAFQGEPGAFSEAAAHAYFGQDAVPFPCASFEAVVDSVSRHEVDFGVLPVENSVAGTVSAAYDALAATALVVVGEIACPIRHCLLAPGGATLSSVRRVLSHPVALAQCMRFFREHPGLEAVAVHDTAGAARRVAQSGDVSFAALASEAAAERYELNILARDLQDRADNQTRFLFVSRPDVPPPRGAENARIKTALMIETENRPGALVSILLPLAERGINLTHLECRPGDAPWTYRFFLDLEGDAEISPTRDALDVVRKNATSFRVLGSFPA